MYSIKVFLWIIEIKYQYKHNINYIFRKYNYKKIIQLFIYTIYTIIYCLSILHIKLCIPYLYFIKPYFNTCIYINIFTLEWKILIYSSLN